MLLIGVFFSHDIGRFVTKTAQLRELASARARWSRSAPSRYRLRLVTVEKGTCTQEVDVQDERVVATSGQCSDFRSRTAPPPSVTGLFNAIESAIREPGSLSSLTGYVRVEVQYHDRLGYPVRVQEYMDWDWGPRPAILIYLPDTTITLTELE
jgi:hypothetical protein